MLNRFMAILFLVFASCADVPSDSTDSQDLGKLVMPLRTQIQSTEYRLLGNVTISQGLDVLRDVSLTPVNDASSIVVDDLEVGVYTVELTDYQLLKNTVIRNDAVLVGGTTKYISVIAGTTAMASFQFRIGEEMVEFSCTEETCGNLRVGFTVTDSEPMPLM